MTLEQYLSVAFMWFAEQQDGYNPFDDRAMFEEDGQSMQIQSQEGDVETIYRPQGP